MDFNLGMPGRHACAAILRDQLPADEGVDKNYTSPYSLSCDRCRSQPTSKFVVRGLGGAVGANFHIFQRDYRWNACRGSAAVTHIPLISLSNILPIYIGTTLHPERNNGAASASRNVPSPDDSPESDILFTPEAAALLRATTQQTSELARKGLIPAFKIGKRWRFSRKTLLEWVEKESTRHLDLFSPSATVPASSEPVKTKPKKRRNFPTDLSPEGLREALKAGNKTGDESASKKRRAK